MKLKKVFSLLNGRKVAYLHDAHRDDGSGLNQWISDGAALYPMYGMPYMDEDSFFAIMDVPQENRGKWVFSDDRPLPYGLSIYDQDDGEIQVTPLCIEIILHDTQLTMFREVDSANGTRFIVVRSKYLAPMSDSYELSYYIRPYGAESVLAVKDGMLLTAIIVPCMEKLDDLTTLLYEAAGLADAERCLDPDAEGG